MSLEDMMERGPIPAQTVANRVCKHLPEGYVLNLAMENGAAWVELIDADGNYVTLPDAGNRSIDEQINDALGVACGASDFNEPLPANDCPHAAPFRYCDGCVADPCPVGLGKN